MRDTSLAKAYRGIFHKGSEVRNISDMLFITSPIISVLIRRQFA
jgi:hypothetical protein